MEPVFVTLRQSPLHHYHTQCFQLPKGRSEAFSQFLNSFHHDMHGFPIVKEYFGPSYCLIEMSNESKLYIPIDSGAYFPAQFAREALISFLQLDSTKKDWKLCIINQEEEVKLVKEFKALLNQSS